MMNRSAIVQLALFVVIALACGYYVATDVLGPRALGDAISVTVRMPDTGGLDEGSQVTYRGTEVGQVSAIRIGDPAGVELEVSLSAGAQVPADTDAVVTMDNPLRITQLDLRPRTTSPPYLASGDVITQERTRGPVPLAELLTGFTELAGSVRTEDVATITDALARGLNGMGPELRRVIDNTSELTGFLADRLPQLRRLADGGRKLMETPGGGNRIRDLAATMRELTGTLRANAPAAVELLHRVPEPARQVATLMAQGQPAISALLGNLVTTSQVVSIRAPALEQALISLPRTLNKMAGIVHGDAADFYLVATQGPVCYNATDRRPPTDTSSRQPKLNWHCPASSATLQQRGAANAPRPGASPSGPASGTSYDPRTGARLPFDLGTGGGRLTGPGPWSSILLRGTK